MKTCASSRLGLGLMIVGIGGVAVLAQDPPRPRSTPIIFSAPKSDTTSSNLSELRAPKSPFRNLENELKRPFEIFDSTTEVRPIRRPVAPQPALNRKSVKDTLNAQAEEMYLTKEAADADKGDDAFFQLGESAADPYKSKPNNALERYYDHLDRTRQAATNQTGTENPFGEPAETKSDALGFEAKMLKSPQYLSTQRDQVGLLPNQPTNLGNLTEPEGDRSLARPNANPFTRTGVEFTTAQPTASESRMEDFKRLLEGSRYSAPATVAPRNYWPDERPAISANLPAQTISATTKAALSGWSTPVASTDPQTSFAKSAGLVGEPEKLRSFPELKSALSTPLPVAPIQPVRPFHSPTFELPKRSF